MYTQKEFVKNIIVTSTYKKFETSKETESQYTQTQEMDEYIVEWMNTMNDNTVNMMEVD